MLCNYLNLNASWFQSQLNIYLFALLISFSIRIYMQSKRHEQRKNIIKTVCLLQQDRKVKERYRPDSPSWMRGSCGEDHQKEPSCYSSVQMYLFSGKSRYHFLSLKDQTHRKKVFLLCKTYGLKQWLRDLLCSAIYCVPPLPQVPQKSHQCSAVVGIRIR